MNFHDTDDGSEEETGQDHLNGNRKRSSRGRRSLRSPHTSKCERGPTDSQCKSCALAGTGPSYKRGPPKGYIHAIEQRWHQVESLLGALIQCRDPKVQDLVQTMRQDELAREIIDRVDMGPYGPSGRQTDGATKEDIFSSILRSNESSMGSRDSSRSRRQSRVSREIVSSSKDRGLAVVPTKEWQDRLAERLAAVSARAPYTASSSNGMPAYNSNSPFESSGVRLVQRRRVGDSPVSPAVPQPPNWNEMYTFDADVRERDGASMEPDTEGMGELSLDEHQEVRFHGKTSGLHLLRRNDRTDDRIEGGIWKLPMARVWPPTKKEMEGAFVEEEVEVNMPSYDLQDKMLDLYFTYIHPIFPPSTRYFSKSGTSSKGSPSDHSTGGSPKPESSQKVNDLLLLSVFAITARFLDEPPPVTSLGGKMWEQGCEWCNSAIKILTRTFHRSQPSTVQSLLLLGYREFGLGSMEHGWLYIGMAIRMAIDLGLNCDPGSWKIHGHMLFAPEEIQTRRQIWWTCMLADSVLGAVSSALLTCHRIGRPIMIKDGDHDTHLPEIDSDEEEQPWQPVASANVAYQPVPARFMSAFRLIVGNIVTEIYPVREPCSSNKRVHLEELENALHRCTTRPIPPPHVLILHVRYWGAILLLHRAFHVSAIINLLRERYSLQRTSPFLTAYLLASGIMHILTLTVRPSNLQASLGLRQCLTALQEMQVVWPSAARAWELLDGVKLGYEKAFSVPQGAGDRSDRKRDLDNAFGPEDQKNSDYLQREAFGTYSNARQEPSPQNGMRDLSQRIMAHMLGLDIPGIEPSTSFYPRLRMEPTGDVFGQPAQLQQMPVSGRPGGMAVPGATAAGQQFANPQMGWIQQGGTNPEVFAGYPYDYPNSNQYGM
ncbi:fungal-specific transcription factor domain-containing protein [Schizophyllum amplum]|uniref:Fungal-specific transcription factor domain-containing protein n=1 Tax=Schizophyllum amplum TaxID=97359 RepID=A0A550CNB4_9AGAR|nr:fungal-specific transcription factor domain-containing protein [Auriculariopsis ampla]